MKDTMNNKYLVSYPLMTSLSHTWMYLIGFSSPMIFYAFIYISFLLLFYYSLRKIVSSKLSIMFTAILSAFPDFYSQGQLSYTNLPYASYLILGGIYLYLGIKFNKKGYFIISMIMTALSGWTRYVEPFWAVSVIVVLIYGILKLKNLYISLIYTSFVYLFRIPWNKLYSLISGGSITIQNQIGGGTSTVIGGLSHNMHLGVVMNYVFTYGIKPFLPLYILCIILLFYKIIYKSKDWWALILTGTLFLLFLGTYIFSFSFPEWINI